LYLPAVCSGFAQSSPDPPLLRSPAGSPVSSSCLSGAPTASSLLWGHPLLCVSIYTWSCANEEAETWDSRGCHSHRWILMRLW
ncbi:unnamed protein product, partial [Staurois parvus]